MKKTYASDAERQRAYRERLSEKGYANISFVVSDVLVQELDGQFYKLIDAYNEVKRLRVRVSELEAEVLCLRGEKVIPVAGKSDDLVLVPGKHSSKRLTEDSWYLEFKERHGSTGISMSAFAREKGVDKTTLSKFFSKKRKEAGD